MLKTEDIPHEKTKTGRVYIPTYWIEARIPRQGQKADDNEPAQ
jgi:hypothetical protein